MPNRKDYDAKLDTGDKAIGCGRRIDILKVWFKIKKYGWDGVVEQVEQMFDRTNTFAKFVKEDPNFILITEPDTFNTCF